MVMRFNEGQRWTITAQKAKGGATKRRSYPCMRAADEGEETGMSRAVLEAGPVRESR